MLFENKILNLPLRFGPKTLFRMKFDGHICRAHFIDLADPAPLPDTKSDLVLYSSFPARQDDGKILQFAGGRLLYAPKRFPRYMAELSGDFETYLDGFGGKTKSTLKRKVRKFFDPSNGVAAFAQYKTPDEMLRFHEIARELSKRTYQEKLLGKGLPEDGAFVANMLDLAASDNVRGYTLHLNGQAVAYLYSPAHDGILYYDYLGFDPAFSSLSPGAVLQFLAFEQIFKEQEGRRGEEQKFRLYDFEEGEGQHKRTFATSCTPCKNLYIFKLSAKSILFVSADFLLGRSSAAILKLLEKTNLKTKFRKLYRR